MLRRAAGAAGVAAPNSGRCRRLRHGERVEQHDRQQGGRAVERRDRHEQRVQRSCEKRMGGATSAARGSCGAGVQLGSILRQPCGGSTPVQEKAVLARGQEPCIVRCRWSEATDGGVASDARAAHHEGIKAIIINKMGVNTTGSCLW